LCVATTNQAEEQGAVEGKPEES